MSLIKAERWRQKTAPLPAPTPQTCLPQSQPESGAEAGLPPSRHAYLGCTPLLFPGLEQCRRRHTQRVIKGEEGRGGWWTGCCSSVCVCWGVSSQGRAAAAAEAEEGSALLRGFWSLSLSSDGQRGGRNSPSLPGSLWDPLAGLGVGGETQAPRSDPPTHQSRAELALCPFNNINKRSPSLPLSPHHQLLLLLLLRLWLWLWLGERWEATTAHAPRGSSVGWRRGREIGCRPQCTARPREPGRRWGPRGRKWRGGWGGGRSGSEWGGGVGAGAGAELRRVPGREGLASRVSRDGARAGDAGRGRAAPGCGGGAAQLHSLIHSLAAAAAQVRVRSRGPAGPVCEWRPGRVGIGAAAGCGDGGLCEEAV